MPASIAKRDALWGFSRVSHTTCVMCKAERGIRFDYETVEPTWCNAIGPRQSDGSLPWCTRKKTNHRKHVFCDLRAEQHASLIWTEERTYSQGSSGARSREFEKVRRSTETPEECDRKAVALAKIFSPKRRLTPEEMAVVYAGRPAVGNSTCEFCGLIAGKTLLETRRGVPRCVSVAWERCSRERGHHGDHVYCDPVRDRHGLMVWDLDSEPLDERNSWFQRDTGDPDDVGDFAYYPIVGVTLADFAPVKIPASSGRGIPPWRRSYLERALLREAAALRTTAGGWERGW